MLTKIAKLPINNDLFLKEWFKEKNNIIKCIPNSKVVENDVLLLNLGFFSPKMRFKFYTVLNDHYVEQKLLEDGGDGKLRIMVILGENAELRITYEGQDENKLDQVLTEFLENIKKNLLSDFKQNNETKSNNFSKELMKVSFLTKLVTSSKLLLDEEKEIYEMLDYVENILEKFHNYPLIYIRGSGEQIFRLLFINNELRGVYIKINENESFNEMDLVKLKGKFEIKVYGRNSTIFF